MPKASRTAATVGEIVRLSSIRRSTTTDATNDNPSPSRMPMIPPRALVAAASMTNCCMMYRSLAPRDFRMPISRVRSVTDTSRMFIMPMPPTTREMAAMPARTPTRRLIILVMVSSISDMLVTV